jgi:hypothetical protein
MAGMEFPIGKNRYVDLNVGIPSVGIKRFEPTKRGGVLMRAGVLIPLKHTSPYSIVYWMPQFNYGRYRVADYTCYACSPQSAPVSGEDLWGEQWAATVDFGYRHVNPSTFFFYEAGVAIGYGGINGNYTVHYNQSPVGGWWSGTNGGIMAIMVSSHISIGFALRQKNGN